MFLFFSGGGDFSLLGPSRRFERCEELIKQSKQIRPLLRKAANDIKKKEIKLSSHFFFLFIHFFLLLFKTLFILTRSDGCGADLISSTPLSCVCIFSFLSFDAHSSPQGNAVLLQHRPPSSLVLRCVEGRKRSCAGFYWPSGDAFTGIDEQWSGCGLASVLALQLPFLPFAPLLVPVVLMHSWSGPSSLFDANFLFLPVSFRSPANVWVPHPYLIPTPLALQSQFHPLECLLLLLLLPSVSFSQQCTWIRSWSWRKKLFSLFWDSTGFTHPGWSVVSLTDSLNPASFYKPTHLLHRCCCWVVFV